MKEPPRVRRCAYLKYGALVSLAFVGCIADEHPEAATRRQRQNRPGPKNAAGRSDTSLGSKVPRCASLQSAQKAGIS